jgi:uncharacterized membrane protein YeaQ/YmgE (transglycosylase-associated protein family)
MSIFGILLLGLIVGALARLLIPGRGPTGILATMAVGVGGAFLGWWIGKSLVGSQGVGLHPWIWALIGSALLVLAYRAITRRGSTWGRASLGRRRRYLRW